MSDERLSRIESKLDRLTDVIVNLARIEERQLDMADGMKRIWRRLEDQDKRFRPLEHKLASIGWVERVVWVVVATGLAVLLKG